MANSRGKKVKALFQCMPDVMGGTEWMLLRLAKSLKQGAVAPTILFPGRGPVIKHFRDAGIATLVVAPPKHGVVCEELVRAIHREKYRVGLTCQLYPLLALAAERAAIPHVWSPGGAAHVAYGHLSPARRLELVRGISWISRKVIFPSEFIRRYYVKLIGCDGVVIRHGIDDKLLSGRVPPLPSLASSSPAFRVGMIAHLLPQKRQIDLIRAVPRVLERFPSATFHLIGTTHPHARSRAYAATLRREVRARRISEHVKFSGFLDDIPAALKNLDLVVLPSVDEVLSNAILEAMACARPVIAANSGGNAELVRHGVTGLVFPPGRPDRLAKAITDLFREPKRLARMGKRARRIARQNHDMTKVARRYEKLLLSCAR